MFKKEKKSRKITKSNEKFHSIQFKIKRMWWNIVTPQVNIYVDAVINHMCGAGGGEGTHSSCGSWFSANKQDFPSVPYSSWDFNDNKCSTGSGNIENYGDPNQVICDNEKQDCLTVPSCIHCLILSVVSSH